MSAPRSRLQGATRRLVVGAVLGLAACTVSPAVGTVANSVARSSLQFAVAPLTQAWAAPATALVAVQRSAGPDRVQMIGLANDTTLEGDNFLWLRARADGRGSGAFRLDEFLSRTEGVPSPFSRVSDRDLRQATDSLGTYFYLEYRTGGQVNCVLAFRRLDGAASLLPRGLTGLEAMLRNCVPGTTADALLPITDRQIGLSTGAQGTTGAQAGGGRMLSSLAGPPQP